MSAKFCLLIPAKILQIKKHFSEKLRLWLAEYEDKIGTGSGLSSYSLYSLSEFQQLPDVYLELPDNICDRYYVIDWGFYFLTAAELKAFISWLADIYVYGEVGVLKYWSDELRRFPPVRIGSTEKNLSDLSLSNLSLDELLFFPLKQANETS
jgi:hypothetical protein